MTHPRTLLFSRTGSGLETDHSHVHHLPISDEDLAADIDEPPERLQFGRKYVPAGDDTPTRSTRMSRSPSLLTQGLTSPDHTLPMLHTAMARAYSTASTSSIISNVSTAELTSDGGFTSPARTSSPSPPLPAAMHTGLGLIPSVTLERLDDTDTHNVSPETQPLAQAPRKRCITFGACPQPKADLNKEKPASAEEAPRRTCLKFVCPLRPDRTEEPSQSARLRKASPAPAPMAERRHRDSESTVKDAQGTSFVETPKPPKQRNPDGLRFHEFAEPRIEDEAWITAGPAQRHKITVTDTLRKENAIRKIGEEAEAEALAEEQDLDDEDLEDELDSDADDDDVDDEDDDQSLGESDGNETDDEEGFADSDEESDDGSEYQFWTPAITTAATSVEHLDHIRPRTRRSASESSIEVSIQTNGVPIAPPVQPAKKHGRTRRHRHLSPRLRPGTPELPDSTDFVCGTFDEDRPLEAAYLACMQQRRIAKKGVLPQDVDPSFPTSDPEPDDDEELDEEDEEDDPADEPVWAAGKLEVDDTPARGRPRSNSARQQPLRKSPNPSPAKTRLRSPPPPPAAAAGARRGKSPAPAAAQRHAAGRLFARSPYRAIAPPADLVPSPPSSRGNSPQSGSDGAGLQATRRPGRLGQRPHQTRTKSLPRTPNPFFSDRRRPRRAGRLRSVDSDATEGSDATTAAAAADATGHSRGPIDIVQGLEQKRQRRRDKFWRQHCRQNAGKERPRPPPGKGAERMRDIGLEMADRCKGYGQRLQLVLSV